ncbi:cytochrome P450 [Mycena epipterygia]|nr:cytochrome P450 [Mycena epipterygia]
MISQILLPSAATLLCYVVLQAVQSIYRNLTSPLRHVVGPKNPSFILGNFKEMADDFDLTQKWRTEFGRNFQFKGLFSNSQLHMSDIKALNHIVTNHSVYQRAPSNLAVVRSLLGKGILGVDGDEHKRHNPAFGVAQIRLVTEVFVEKSVQLRDSWAREIAQETTAIEVLSGLRRMTLDVIGQAGFNYQFDALESHGKPLSSIGNNETKLREELLTLSTDNPTMDELNALPYLDKVIRETMRVHSPVMFNNRMAVKDDVLPLAKPYIDKAGTSHDTLPIPKGQMIHIPIWAVNTDKEIWGEDPNEFMFSRALGNLPEAVSDIPSVWANQFTFFAGPTNCIGFRFALVEMKVLLFTLIRAFEFAPAVPKGGIGSSAAGLIQRPTVLANKREGTALPLIVKRFNAQGY